MADRPTDGGSFPQDRYAHPEAALGGADAVEKTSYVTGSGTEPESQKPVDAPGGPRTASHQGPNTTWIVLAFFLVAAVLVYLLGFGR